jgi:hypothetical protein
VQVASDISTAGVEWNSSVASYSKVGHRHQLCYYNPKNKKQYVLYTTIFNSATANQFPISFLK